MEIDQSDLMQLLEGYAKLTSELNDSIDQEVTAKNTLAIAQAEVKKNQHKVNLVKEQIMCAKKTMDATRG